jgi:hypothetical protein
MGYMQELWYLVCEKDFWDKTTESGSRSWFYVCSREGFRSKNEPRDLARDVDGLPCTISCQINIWKIPSSLRIVFTCFAGPFDTVM